MTSHAHTISPSRLEEITVTEQAPTGLEYKTLALAGNHGGDLLHQHMGVQAKSLPVADVVGGIHEPYEYVDDNGVRVGVAESFVAVTGVIDKVNDIIPPGSFARTLRELEPKACLGHDWNRPIGYPESIEEWLPGDPRLPEKKVDGTPWPEQAGVLRAVTRYNLDTEDGLRAYTDAKFFGPQRTCWSIGYVASETKTRHGVDPASGRFARYLHDLDLYEYSQVLHGAHPMALSQSIKSGEPVAIETKARFVQDQAYWGYPKGTPIRPGMRPRGKTAQRLRAQGKVPSPTQGVTTDAPKPDAPVPGRRAKPDAINAATDAEGLFPEGDSEGRVRAENPTGKDEKLVGELAMTVESEDREFADSERDRTMRGLLKEGITPNELRSDLENVADNDNNENGTGLEPDDIDDIVEDYTGRYNALAKRQSRQRRGEPAEEEGAPAPDQDVTPDAGATGEDAAPSEEEGATPEGEAPAASKLTADGLMMMSTQQMNAALAQADDDNLASLDDEMTRRAAALGKPGKRSKQHAAVIAERDKRAAAGPGETGTGAPQDAAASKLNARQRAILMNATQRDGQWWTRAHANSAYSMRKAGLLGNEGPKRGDYPLTDEGVRIRETLGGTPGAPTAPTTPESPDADVPGAPTMPGEPEVGPVGEEALGHPLSELSDEQLETYLTESRNEVGDLRQLVTSRERSGSKVSSVLRNGLATAEAHNAELERESARRMNGGQGETPEGTEEGTTEGTEQGVDNADDQEDGGQEPPVQPDTGDIPGDIAPDAGAPDAGAPPGPEQVPPRTPLNERGDSYDADGNLIEGNGRFGDAENAALDALSDGDEIALGEALDEMRAGNFVELSLADGTRLRRSESTGALAAELINSDPATARRRVLEWAATGNARHRADTENQHWAQVAAYDELNDDDLDAEEARLLALRAEWATASGPDDKVSPYDTVLWENGIMLRALAESRRKRGEDTLPGADEAEPDEPDGAVITNDEIADAEELADAAHGITEADDGVIEVDPDVAARQERVAGLLTQASTGGGLDLSGHDDNQLRADRSDVVAELRLQTHLDNRRRRQGGDNADGPAGPGEGGASTRRRASGEITDDTDEGKPEQPPGPPTRPGVAGAAEDFADALESGTPADVDRTRARLASSLRRSRSDTDAVKALRALMDGPADPNPQDLRDAAEAVRADARARRNEQARNRRTARRFERERLRSLLGQIEAEMSNRGIDYDTAPEDFASPDNDGALPGGAINPTAGTWVQRTERTEWSGQEDQVMEVSGSHYRAAVYTPQGRRSTYEWTVTNDEGNTVAHGSGETPDQPSAQAAIEIALDTQAKLGNLPADAVLPTGMLPTDSSRRATEEVDAALDAVRERLTRPGRPVNPITGMPDPLTGPSVITRPPTSRAFDDAAAVRAHLEARNVPETTAFSNTPTTTVPLLDKIRWDDVTLSPGGQFMVTTLTGENKPVLMSTTHGLTVRPASGGIAPDRLAKADLLRIGALMETMRDNEGRSVDWTLETRDQSLKRAMDQMDFGPNGTGQDAIMGTALRTLATEKLRAGKWTDKLVRQVGHQHGSGAGVTNWTRRDYVSSTHRVLTLQLSNGFGHKQTTEERKTLAIADGAQLLASMGAPDAAAVLLRRRAAELGAADNVTPLLENLAIGYLGMYSPVRSMGDRAVNLRLGERLSFADPDTGGVRTFRALSPMRSEGTYGGSTALVVDEATGKMFDAKIGNAVGGGQRISLYNRDIHEGRGYADHTSDLGSSGFAVTGPGERVPVDRDELQATATADAAAFGDDVLDAAADTLPESAAERDKRRGSTPDGERPPRRTSPRAPRRRAPKVEDVKPVPGEAHLADVQGRHRDKYMGGDFTLADEAGSGGFDSLDDAHEYAAAWVAAADPEDYRGPDGSGPIKPGYMVWRVANDDTFTERGGARLSPGGHFIITKDNLVVHAKTGGAVWGMQATMEGTQFATRDSAMAVADYLERARFDGKSIDWAATRSVMARQAREALGTRATGETLQPGAWVARAAIVDLLANTKTAPKADDLDSLRNLTDVLDRQGLGISNAPNPDVFTVYENRLKNNRYSALAGARIQGADMLPANSKAGERVAKKVRDEFRIAEGLGQVAPLDAVRRLTAVADSLDGQEITDSDGKTFNPAADLRALATQITDTWDPDKPSPLGRLLRNDSTGTILPKRPIEIESLVVGTQPTADEAEREAERLSRVLARYPLRLDRDDNGDLRARFGLNEIVSDGFSEKIEIKMDGSINITWPHNKVGRMRLYLPPGSWDFDPNMDTGLPDATGVGTGGAGSGELGDTDRDALEKLAAFREQAVKQVSDALGATIKPGFSTDINDRDYDAGFKITQDVVRYVSMGQFDQAKQGLRTINRFYRSSVRSDFDAEDLSNQIDSLSVTDEVLAEAAPFAPAVGGTPEKRAAVNELMFGITADGHPDAIKQLKHVALYDGGIEGAKSNVLADYNLNAQTMRVAGTALDNPDDMTDEGGGWFSQSGLGLLDRTLTHEYGHHLHNMLIKDDPAANQAMMEEIAETMGIGLRGDERGYGAVDWVPSRQSTIVARVGTYAATNHYELIAELFTEWRGKKDEASEYAQVVGRFLGNPSFEGGDEETLPAGAPPAPATGDQQRANLAARTQDYFGADEAAPEDGTDTTETGGEVNTDDDEAANA